MERLRLVTSILCRLKYGGRESQVEELAQHLVDSWGEGLEYVSGGWEETGLFYLSPNFNYKAICSPLGAILLSP
jgi:hypothetical protein